MNLQLRKTLAALAVALTTAASIVVVSASPAQAATCTASIESPYRIADRVQASGEVSSGCQGTWQLVLYRQRWYGWQKLDGTMLCLGCWGLVSWVCTGSGTYRYRTSLYVGNSESKSLDADLSC